MHKKLRIFLMVSLQVALAPIEPPWLKPCEVFSILSYARWHELFYAEKVTERREKQLDEMLKQFIKENADSYLENEDREW